MSKKPDSAMKNDDSKVRVELVTTEFIWQVAEVMTLGAKKYEAWNWTKGLPWMRTYAAVMRHMYLWASGEDKDPESGLSHLAHAAANIMFLTTWSRTKKDLDDRPRL